MDPAFMLDLPASQTQTHEVRLSKERRFKCDNGSKAL